MANLCFGCWAAGVWAAGFGLGQVWGIRLGSGVFPGSCYSTGHTFVLLLLSSSSTFSFCCPPISLCLPMFSSVLTSSYSCSFLLSSPAVLAFCLMLGLVRLREWTGQSGSVPGGCQ